MITRTSHFCCFLHFFSFAIFIVVYFCFFMQITEFKFVTPIEYTYSLRVTPPCLSYPTRDIPYQFKKN